MKFTPYPVLLATGGLMLATVLFAQTDASVALLQSGAASLDKDVSSLTAKTRSARPEASRTMFADTVHAVAAPVASADGKEAGVSQN